MEFEFVCCWKKVDKVVDVVTKVETYEFVKKKVNTVVWVYPNKIRSQINKLPPPLIFCYYLTKNMKCRNGIWCFVSLKFDLFGKRSILYVHFMIKMKNCTFLLKKRSIFVNLFSFHSDPNRCHKCSSAILFSLINPNS